MGARKSTTARFCLWIATVTAVIGAVLLTLPVLEATHSPPVASFSIDVDPTGAISGTTPQAYIADPNFDGSPADNSLTQGTVDGCIDVPIPGVFTINVVGRNMRDVPFYDVRFNFDPNLAAIDILTITYTPFIDNLGNVVGFINLPFDSSVNDRREASSEGVGGPAFNVDNVAGTAFFVETYNGPRTAADSPDEPHASADEPARPYTAGPGGVPIVKLSLILKPAAVGQFVTLDLTNTPAPGNDYGSFDPATGQEEIIPVPESNLTDGVIAVAPATCATQPTPTPTAVVTATPTPTPAPVASFSVDVDPAGATSGTTPQAYIADPNGDLSPADNSLTQGTVDACINVPGPGSFVINVVGRDMRDMTFYDVRLNFNPNHTAIDTPTITYTPFVDNLGKVVGFINLPFDSSVMDRRRASSEPANPFFNVDNVAGTAFFSETYIGPRTTADSADEPHASADEPARPYTAGPGGVPIVKLSAILKPAAAGQLVTLDLTNTPAPGNDYGSFNPASGQTQTVPVPEANLTDGRIAVAPATCPGTSTPTPTATPTSTPTSTPSPAGHDAGIVRISGVPKNARLSPGETISATTSIVVINQSGHTDNIGVYVDVVAPAAGGCTPSGRVLGTTVSLAAGARTTLNIPVGYSCANPAAANGMSYTWVAVADHGADDGAACGPGALQTPACSNALANDDADPADNLDSRVGPRVIAR